MRITRREPIRAFLLLDALKDETRRKIIDILLEKKEVTLTDVQKILGKTLPTLLFHFTLLEKTGLITWKIAKKGRKRTKVYSLRSELVNIELDLNLISKIPKVSEVAELAKKYIEKETEEGYLSREPSVQRIAEILGVNTYLATAVKNYIEVFEEDVARILVDIVGSNNLREMDPEEISNRYNLDLFWVVKAIKLIK